MANNYCEDDDTSEKEDIDYDDESLNQSQTSSEYNELNTKNVEDHASVISQHGSEEISTFEQAETAEKVKNASYVDHGWAWMIVVGCSLMHFLVGGFARSYGIMYVYLQTRFDSSAAVTAWVGGSASSIRMLTSPFATACTNKFGARSVVIVGGVLCGLGGILSAFAPSTEYMFFSFSFFEGFGGALVYAPGLIMVGQYFDKYRSIAMGLATAGSGLGVFLYPPIMQVLFHHYGFFGAMLISGAIMFNNIISGAIYRPTPKSTSIDEIKLLDETSQKQEKCPGSKCNENQNNKSMRHEILKKLNGSLSSSSKSIVASNTSHSATHKTGVEKNAQNKDSSCNMMKFHKYLDLRLFKMPTFLLFSGCLAFATLSYISGQMLVVPLAQDAGISKDKSVWLLSVIGISDTIGRVGSGFLYNIPIIKQHRRHYYLATILISGITHFILAGTKAYLMFIIICAIHGFFTGFVVSQRAVICIDLMGIENLSSALGLIVFMQGTGLLLGPAVAGLLRDLSGTYFYSFIFTGASSMLSAAFLFLEWLLISRHSTKTAGKGKKKHGILRIDTLVVNVGAMCDKKYVLESEDVDCKNRRFSSPGDEDCISMSTSRHDSIVDPDQVQIKVTAVNDNDYMMTEDV